MGNYKFRPLPCTDCKHKHFCARNQQACEAFYRYITFEGLTRKGVERIPTKHFYNKAMEVGK